jgi:Lrp/AsnC family transcriptional regulator, leucine-responsive regulatory protein
MIDSIDAQILTILQTNSRTSNAEIARQLSMAPSAIFERIKRLEERGNIEGFGARLNPRPLNLGLLAFIQVRSKDRVSELSTAQRLAQFPEVLEVHHVAGEDCYLLKVRAADTESLGRLLRNGFGGIESIVSTRTTIVLETLKETSALPVQGGRPCPEENDRA